MRAMATIEPLGSPDLQTHSNALAPGYTFFKQESESKFGCCPESPCWQRHCLKPPLPNPLIPALSPHLLFFWTLNNPPHGSLAGQMYGEMNIPPTKSSVPMEPPLFQVESTLSRGKQNLWKNTNPSTYKTRQRGGKVVMTTC